MSSNPGGRFLPDGDVAVDPPAIPLSVPDPNGMTTKGVRLSFIDAFINACGGREALAGKTTSVIAEDLIKPMTLATRQSVVAVLESSPVVAEAAWHVSHTWKQPFLDTVDALHDFFERRDVAPDDAVVWLDPFSSNQHGAIERPFEWWTTVFRDAIRKMGNLVTVLMPLDDSVALKSAWCVMDVVNCHALKSDFHIATTKAERDRFAEALSSDPGLFYTLLSTISISKCKASKNSDTEAILRLADDGPGADALDRMVLDALSKLLQHDLESRIAASTDDDTAQLKWSAALGGLLQDRGLYSQAEPFLSTAVDTSRRLYGPDDAQTLSHLNALLVLYRHLGLLDKALPLHIDLYARSVATLGDTHTVTLQCAHDLALLHIAVGSPSAAEPLITTTLTHRREQLGDTNPSTLATSLALASLHRSKGALDHAEPLLVSTLSALQERLGPSHPLTLRCIASLSSLHASQRASAKAEPAGLSCLRTRRRVLGDDHPDVLQSLHEMAVLYHIKKAYDKAEGMYVECLEGRRRVLGERHRDTEATRTGLAVLYKKVGKKAEAAALYG
ncbi:Kinesin light chain 3, partial [Irineochytrium annulatum]